MSHRDFWKTITTKAAFGGATPDAARWQRLKHNRRLLPAMAASDAASFWLAVGAARTGGKLSQEQYMNLNQPDLTRMINDAFGLSVNGRTWTVQMVLDSPDSTQARVKELLFVNQDMAQPFAVGIASLPWQAGSRRFGPR